MARLEPGGGEVLVKYWNQSEPSAPAVHESLGKPEKYQCSAPTSRDSPGWSGVGPWASGQNLSRKFHSAARAENRREPPTTTTTTTTKKNELLIIVRYHPYFKRLLETTQVPSKEDRKGKRLRKAATLVGRLSCVFSTKRKCNKEHTPGWGIGEYQSPQRGSKICWTNMFPVTRSTNNYLVRNIAAHV